ncbi:MAG: hypothetical protein ACREBR_00845 [bacterium]
MIPRNATNVVELVDALLTRGERALAENYLDISGGHGRVRPGWIVDCAIQSWREGISLFDESEGFRIEGSNLENCRLFWNNEEWVLFDCSFTMLDDLKNLFTLSLPHSKSSRL